MLLGVCGTGNEADCEKKDANKFAHFGLPLDVIPSAAIYEVLTGNMCKY
jgi:hypothetical protein